MDSPYKSGEEPGTWLKLKLQRSEDFIIGGYIPGAHGVDQGEIYTVRYEAVNAMLLNEFLKQHLKVEEQGATIAQMKKQIETLTATVQRVSDQVALSRTEPKLVVNP